MQQEEWDGSARASFPRLAGRDGPHDTACTRSDTVAEAQESRPGGNDSDSTGRRPEIAGTDWRRSAASGEVAGRSRTYG